MRRADYEQIARTYDDARIRTEIDPDEALGEVLRAGARVLDVGCGTGAWLRAQRDAFGARGAEWFGVDPSEAMLARARAKLPDADLRRASAESLPFPAAHFRFVATRFAFHHFEDKPRALDEMTRVLEPGGTLLVANIAVERMSGWWVFRFFPESRAVNERYWPVERLAAELEARGYDAAVDVRVARGEIRLTEALAVARTRDQSHLFMLDDDVWAERLADLEAAAARDPDGSIPTEAAVMVAYATPLHRVT
jgi:ubiquinone/menaquinone biosynthesis C-methylase UbiE